MLLNDWWNFFWDSLRILTKEGARTADPMHFTLIDAVLQKLDSDSAKNLRKQLKHRYYFSWMSDGRINVFRFYDQHRLPLISDTSFADKLYKVELFVENKKHIALVTFYERRIYSIEFKKPRKFFKGKPYRVGSVMEGKPKESYTAAIDRAAHGKEMEINP